MRKRFVVLAALAAASPLAATPASAAPKHNRGLTIAAAPDPIIAGDGVIIYGRLLGPSAANQAIDLYHRVNPSHHFTLIGHATTDSNGYYSFTRQEGVVMSNRSWFVRGPANTHSRTVRERVAALVTLTASATNTDTSAPVTFTGKVTPSQAGHRVLLQAQHDGANGWSTLRTARIAPDSSYSFSYRWRTPGVRNVRVVFTGDGRNLRSASDAVSVTIQQAQIAGFTIGSTAPVISYGQSATVAGVLDQPGTASPAPNTSVTLYGRTAGANRFAPIAADVTGNDGSYSFAISPPRNEVLYVRETLDRKVHTADLFEAVRDVVTLSSSSPTAATGGQVTLTGNVVPNKDGEWIYLQRLGKDGAWHSVAAERLDHSSDYSFTVRFGSAGSKQLRTRIYGDARNAGATSPPVTITVNGTTAPSSLPPGS